ncbi:hypothetical protein AAFG07_34815 [Bradyrhizobium sp. B097]|uniref:hypothetical protein n=1 Tax=Bradyrhizobium sp. B097 TaxID=3140244 RepID=UPI0031840CB0
MQQADDRDPGMGDRYLARGQMRIMYRLVEEEDPKLLQLVADAMRKGVPTDDFFETIEENETLRDCLAALGIDPKECEGLGREKTPLVFVSGDSPAFKMWEAHYRKEAGHGVPLNNRFGWYFPSEYPPA